MSTNNFEVDFEREYRLWLESVLTVTGYTRGQFAHEVRKTARSLAVTQSEIEDARSLTDAAVRNWFSRPSLPSASRPILTKSLITVVEKSGMATPLDAHPNLKFSDIVRGLRELHFGNSKTGRKIPLISQTLIERECLLHEVSSSREINEIDLALGSWVLDGQVPTYCARDIDSELIERLEDNRYRFTFLIGPPKAGKTRTLLQALKTSSKGDWPTFWVSPTPGAIDEVLRQLQGLQLKNIVFVLDDLQRFPFDSDRGLNFQKLDALAHWGIVVGTIHTSTVERWRAAKIDHRDGADKGFPGPKSLALLLSSTLELDAKLSTRELAIANEALAETPAANQEILHLPAFLASVDALVQQAKLLQHGQPIEQAVINALIDTKILFPEGVGLETIRQFTITWMNFNVPNVFFSESAYENTLVSVTTGVTAGSPHSILMPNLDNPEKFSLMDAVWEGIAPEEWQTDHINLEDIGHFQVSRAAFQQGYFETTIDVLIALGPLLEGEHFMLMGLASQYLHSLDEAKKWYTLGVEYEDVECLQGLLELQLTLGGIEEAETTLGAYNLLSEAQVDLYRGIIARAKGDRVTAEDLLRRSAEAGEPAGAFNLASMFAAEGKMQEVLYFAEQAAQGGFELAKILIAASHADNGRFEEAEKLAEPLRAIFPQSTLLLANICFRRNELDQASQLIEEAESVLDELVQEGFFIDETYTRSSISVSKAQLAVAKKDFQAASSYLDLVVSDDWAHQTEVTRLRGVIESELGNFEEAVSILEPISNLPPAALDLAIVYLRQDKRELALAQYRRAGELGNWTAYMLLADILSREGRHEEAVENYQLGASADVLRTRCLIGKGWSEYLLGRFDDASRTLEMVPDAPLAANNLGVIAMRLGDEDIAIERFRKAAAGGERLALLNLSDIYIRRGDWESALGFAQKGEDLNDPDLIMRLGLIADQKNDTERARIYFERAAGLGQAWAAYCLGLHYQEVDDEDRAVHWFSTAADLGEVEGHRSLGFLYWDKPDRENAQNYFELAHSAGDSFSGCMLSEMDCETGNFESAIERLKPLVDEGYVQAMCLLSDIYKKLKNTKACAYWKNRVKKTADIEEIKRYIEFLDANEYVDRSSGWRKILDSLEGSPAG